MLILSRKVGESIIIDGETEIKVMTISGNHVKLGVNAPDHVRVDRKEIHDRKVEELAKESDHEA